ncbi:50S ribosomal protein L11 methyltransferase [Streptomyces sp. Isolate_45]|uniref:50S ribosomal protein L11 methyltransferase n=1 Tax=Streptomyces sp. Isolate_45 TaxID=2950111 RepID=UPI0024819D7B|nr:50S ribosomal protein L11 methyltransferase [Streptomyces sp. Isolate_45]MDA5279817.1 50S ribosomal protein L11 methyltransferase [Streptomyces sp. Isolate_45]
MPGADFLPHHLLLRDTRRMEAYRVAIDATVRPGDTVVDLGTGSGILAVFAARAGAKRVIAVEVNPDVARLARQITRAGGFGDVIEVVTGHSAALDIGEPVDAIVCDALGFFGLCSELDELLAARARWAPSARLVPRRLTVWLSPVEAPDATRWLDLTEDHPYAGMLGPTRRVAFNLPVLMELAPGRRLAAGARAGSLELDTATGGRVRSAPAFRVERDGLLSGLCGWYHAELGGGATLGSEPGTRRPMARTRFFPLDRPAEVRAGDLVRTEVSFGPTLSCWAVEVVREGAVVQRSEQSSLMANAGWDGTGLDGCPPTLGALAVFAAGDDAALDELAAGSVPARYAALVPDRKPPAGLDLAAFVAVVRAEHRGHRGGVFTGP